MSFIGEVGPGFAINREYPNLGPRVSIVDHHGKLLARIGDNGVGIGLGQFLGPHGIAVDTYGDLYVAELGSAGWGQRYPDKATPTHLPNLKKLVRVGNYEGLTQHPHFP